MTTRADLVARLRLRAIRRRTVGWINEAELDEEAADALEAPAVSEAADEAIESAYYAIPNALRAGVVDLTSFRLGYQAAFATAKGDV